LNSEYDFIHGVDVASVGEAYRELIRLGRLEAGAGADLEEELRLVLYLKSKLHHHHCIPVALGSGMSSLVHELQSLFHQWFMESGSSKLMQRMCMATVAFLSDKGTERGLCTAPPVKFGDMLPHFVPYVFDDDGMNDLAGDIDPDDLLHMPNALQVSGGHHLVNNIAKNLVLFMKHYEDSIYPLLNGLANALHEQYWRERLVSTCFKNGHAAAYAFLFNSFPDTLIKFRFGSIARVVKALLKVEFALKLGWSKDAMAFQNPAGEPVNANRPHSDHLEGPKLQTVDEAIRSSYLWAWLHMFGTIADILGHMDNWFKACPCHRMQGGGVDNSAWQGHRSALKRRLGLPEETSCPLVGRRAPELCAGDFARFSQQVLGVSSADICLRHSSHCTAAQKAALFEDWEAGRMHLVGMIRLHTESWKRLPRSLAIAAHADPHVARAGLLAAFQEYDGLAAEDEHRTHALTKARCDAM
jgi:hypothetical protein